MRAAAGTLTLAEERRPVRVPLDSLRPGLTAHADGFLVLAVAAASGALSVLRVVSSACAHASGTLVPTAGCLARCPHHGWELDVERCRYTNVQHEVPELAWTVEGGELIVTVVRQARSLDPALRPRVDAPMHLRYLAHACVAVECGGFRLVIDPWLEGPCFLGGWWHAHPVPSDAREVLLGADAVFLSHNHPDHLHAPTLALLPRDTLILVPDFASGSVERAVRALGFTRIQALRQDDLFELGPALVLACIFAGDGRDDSGLYLASASGDVLLTVDANRLGNMALPSGVDVLLTSFASGASGFPVCFDTVSGPRCEAILARNRHAARSALEAYVRATRPQVWMPYAGFFTEADPRDASVHARNVKNTAEDVAEWLLARVEGLRAVLPLAHPRLLVHQHRVRADADIAVPHLSAHDPLSWRAARRARVGPLDEERLEAQLRGSGFQDDLILLLVPTDDSFAPIASAAWCVDFRAGPLVRRLPAAEALALLERAKQQGGDSPRHLLLRVREDSLAEAVALDRPWEDLTIGFQCRVDRHPDVYNSNFWHHFTNILPGRAHG